MKTAILSLLIGLISALAGPARAAEPPRPERPNVIVLMTDDNGYGDLSCHGNPVLKTPNFDRLHDQSVRLTDFHVAPMCTPTRGQLMTGKDALHNGASSVCAGRSFLRPGIPTMAEVFAAAGYRTAMFGKWHLGDSYPEPAAPARLPGGGLPPRLGHHVDGRPLGERLLRRPLLPQRRP